MPTYTPRTAAMSPIRKKLWPISFVNDPFTGSSLDSAVALKHARHVFLDQRLLLAVPFVTRPDLEVVRHAQDDHLAVELGPLPEQLRDDDPALVVDVHPLG